MLGLGLGLFVSLMVLAQRGLVNLRSRQSGRFPIVHKVGS